jgi:hypothetical protein
MYQEIFALKSPAAASEGILKFVPSILNSEGIRMAEYGACDVTLAGS